MISTTVVATRDGHNYVHDAYVHIISATCLKEYAPSAERGKPGTFVSH